jgi:hypothetical protein
MNALLAAAFFSTPLAMQTDTDWFTVDDNELFTFELPSYMEKTTDLNDEAACEYQYVDSPYQKGGREIYMLVMFETKEEIEEYELDFTFDAKNYWELAVESLTEPLKAVKILSPELRIENFNEMNLTRSFVFAKFGKIKVYYNLAVYEGEHAFYQVLAWTVNEHFEYYKPDMERIIESFQEK